MPKFLTTPVMIEDEKTINIPAFKRKRSIAAKLRSTNQKSPTNKPTITSRRKRDNDELSSLISDIPARDDSVTIEDLLSIPKERVAARDLREMEECGYCDGYFDNINVAVIKVTSPIRQGDRLVFEKEGGLFEQTIKSMQIERKDVKLARSGSDIGMKVLKAPKVGTPVYKVKE